MSSQLDVTNDALEWLSEPPSTGPDDDSTWVVRINNAYDREVKKLFEIHTWNFSLTKAQLAAVGDTPDGWSYGFGKPVQCKRIVKVAASSNPTAGVIDYVDFGGRILTNSEDTWLDYVDGTKIDTPGMWPEVFAGALACKIAVKVAGVFGKSNMDWDRLYKAERKTLSEAKLWDANQNGPFVIPPGEYEKARYGFSRRYNG